MGWLHSDNTKGEVHKSEAAFEKVISHMKKIFPRFCGNNWEIPKKHGYMFMQKYVQIYGNPSNFYGDCGECYPIEGIKDNGLCIQRQAGNFNETICEPICEGVILKKADDTLITKLTDRMHLLPIASSQLRKKYDQMNSDKCNELSNSPITALQKEFCVGLNVTVIMEETWMKINWDMCLYLAHFF